MMPRMPSAPPPPGSHINASEIPSGFVGCEISTLVEHPVPESRLGSDQVSASNLIPASNTYTADLVGPPPVDDSQWYKDFVDDLPDTGWATSSREDFLAGEGFREGPSLVNATEMRASILPKAPVDGSKVAVRAEGDAYAALGKELFAALEWLFEVKGPATAGWCARKFNAALGKQLGSGLTISGSTAANWRDGTRGMGDKYRDVIKKNQELIIAYRRYSYGERLSDAEVKRLSDQAKRNFS